MKSLMCLLSLLLTTLLLGLLLPSVSPFISPLPKPQSATLPRSSRALFASSPIPPPSLTSSNSSSPSLFVRLFKKTPKNATSPNQPTVLTAASAPSSSSSPPTFKPFPHLFPAKKAIPPTTATPPPTNSSFLKLFQRESGAREERVRKQGVALEPRTYLSSPFKQSPFSILTALFANITSKPPLPIDGPPLSVSLKNYFSSFLVSAQNTWPDNAVWVPLLPKAEIEPGVLKPVTTSSGLKVLIIAPSPVITASCPRPPSLLSAKPIYVIANRCPCCAPTPLELGKLSAALPTKTGNKGAKTPCISCPIHRTTFDLRTGELVGEWRPYPPILGKVLGGLMKKDEALTIFKVREKGQMLELKISGSIV